MDEININRDIFTENYVTDIVTTILVFIISGIATIGGVGGGGILLPLYMILNGFTVYEAIPLSVTTILGNTIVRIIYYYPKKHPNDTNRRLIYMLPILIIAPFDANTSFIGIIVSSWTPRPFTLIIIVLVLGITFFKTIRNGIRKYRKEKEIKDRNPNIRKHDEIEITGNQKLIIDNIQVGGESRIQDNHGSNIQDNLESNIQDNPELNVQTKVKSNIKVKAEPNLDETDQLIDNRSREGSREYEIDGITIELGNPDNMNPNNRSVTHGKAKDTGRKMFWSMSLMFGVILVISGFSIGRGKFGLCDNESIGLIVGQFVLVGIIGIVISRYVVRESGIRKDNNYPLTESDIYFDKKKIFQLIGIATITGSLSTYMGIGGGMLINPILISQGLAPDVVAATATVTTMFSSMISVINYVISDKLIWKYGLVWCAVSAGGSAVGLWVLSKIGRDRQSVIVLLIGIIIFASIVMIVTNTILSDGIEMLSDFTFNDVCET